MKRIIATILPLLAAAIFSPAVQAWTTGQSETSAAGARPAVPLTNPEPRCCMGMDYDSVNDGFIQFGGTGDDEVVLGDTWMGKWSAGPPETFDWTEQLTPTTPPEARHSHRMVFWPGDGVMVLFGGIDAGSPGVVLGDTWIGTAGSSGSFEWQEVFPSPAPSARYSFGMAYDASIQKIILYGGQGGGFQDDTWTGSWNASTEVFTWTEVCDPCDPGPLSSPAIGHDTDSVARTVMHGGRDTTGPTNNTWVWDPSVSDWVDKTGSSTTVALYSHRMSFDSSRHRFILFGGTTSGSNVLDRTYVGVRQSGFYNWTEVNPNPEPSGRCCVGMGYDSDRQEIIMFGGAEEGHAKLDDTWRMDTNWDCIAGTCS